MAKRPKTGGRKKGTPNKTTVAVKEALDIAFKDMGGVTSLVEWGRENQTDFYKIWARLLPKEIKAEVNTDAQPGVVLILPDNGRDPKPKSAAAKQPR